MTCLNSFFGNINSNSYSFHCFSTNFLKRINIFLYDDFIQLSLVSDNILYILPIASKASIIVITKKIIYDIFTETVILIKIMQQ